MTPSGHSKIVENRLGKRGEKGESKSRRHRGDIFSPPRFNFLAEMDKTGPKNENVNFAGFSNEPKRGRRVRIETKSVPFALDKITRLGKSKMIEKWGKTEANSHQDGCTPDWERNRNETNMKHIFLTWVGWRGEEKTKISGLKMAPSVDDETHFNSE